MVHKVLTVVGARPQFVKAAVLRRIFDQSDNFEEILVHTGQHFDFNMSGVFFSELGIKKAEYELDINAMSHGAMTGAMLARLESIMREERPDLVLVYGDTNSTLAGALAAAKLHIPVGHVEAGLRSFNKAMPEEINRVLTDHVSRWLFCSTRAGVENLRNESIVEGVHHVGDIMFDAVRLFTSNVDADDVSKAYGVDPQKLAICTLHRAENFSDAERARRIIDFVAGYSDSHDVLLPLHPGTRKKLQEHGISVDRLKLVDPLPYLEMQKLLSLSKLVLTDSGGLQKEAYFHQVPCLTLRDETEWVETVECGWNALWTHPVFAERKAITDYGDGNAGEIIYDLLKREMQ